MSSTRRKVGLVAALAVPAVILRGSTPRPTASQPATSGLSLTSEYRSASNTPCSPHALARNTRVSWTFTGVVPRETRRVGSGYQSAR